VDRPQQLPGDPAPASSRSTYPPVEQLMALRSRRARRTWTGGRLGTRLRGDAQLLLAIAIALAVLAVEGVAENPRRMLGMLAPAVFVGAQLALTMLRSAPAWLPTARLAFCLAFLAMANVWVDASGNWPLGAIAIPVVALAAAEGGRGGTFIAVAGMVLMALPLALPGPSPASRQAGFAIVMAAVAIAYGSRRVVANLERSSARLRRANLRARRRARELAAVESVGRLLAREGLTEGALDGVMRVLEDTFGYRYPSVYVLRGSHLELGAQRNYRNPIQVISADEGVIGRVVRTRQAAFMPDARSDPDFLSADPAIVSEISIPLDHDDELFGVLNVETSGDRRLDEDDFATMQIVGDRLAAALALGRERQKLTERAALLDRLTSFATGLGSSLDPATMDDEVATGAALVIPADSVVLVSLDEPSGQFLISAVAGGDPSMVGKVVEAGEGVTGGAIAGRAVVAEDRLARSSFPRAVADVRLPDVLAGMAAPMVIDDRVVGVVTWLRGDLTRPFTAQEREIAGLLAGRVGLALANARLHQQTADAAIRDPLTGLHNRRHFDATVARDDAVRRRTAAERRPLRSAIIFDLDHFGRVNKRHGHQVGDRVLRLFADTLRARARASDLVARYGGEEFVVILDNATREAAAAIAEDVRNAFAKLTVDVPGGGHIANTVSAGCATLEPWEIEGSVLLERGDVALAMAKHGGRNLVVSA
jgi:diguanylate cyclase (GGDEF)-like protein